MIGRDRNLIERLRHRHRRAALQNFTEQTVMPGIKMQYQHKSHTRIGRTGAKKRLKGFKAASRSADADDREVSGSKGRRLDGGCFRLRQG